MNKHFFHCIGFVYIVNSVINERERTAYKSLEKEITKFSLKGSVMLIE